jgi:hypothetical protein
MFRPFVFVLLLSPFLLSQVRVSTNGTDFKAHGRIDVQVTNAGKDAVSYCVEFGQTSFKTGTGATADAESTPIPFYVQRQVGDKWSTLMNGPDIGSIRKWIVLKPGESQQYPFRLSDRGRMRVVLSYWRSENERTCQRPNGKKTARSNVFVVN